MNTREKAQQTIRTAHSYQGNHSEGIQTDHQNQVLSTRHASIYRNTKRPHQTPSRNRSTTENSNPKHLHTLVCLPKRSVTAPSGAVRGEVLGGAK